jgi:AcrR family transcriptional regulator
MFSEHVQSRAERREATRDRVLASAERLFRAKGFGGTTIRQIAADAGVSIGTVMAVGDKDALLVAIFDAWIAAVHEGRRDRYPHDGRSPGAPAAPEAAGPAQTSAAPEAAVEVVKPFLAHFMADRELSREYAAIIVRGGRSKVFEDLALDLLRELAAVFTRAGFAQPEAERAARAVHLSYLGLLMIVANGGLDQQSALDQLEDVVRFLMQQKGARQ